MTDWFEVLERDGPARLGELRLETALRTPALVDDVLDDAGGIWAADRPLPEGSADAVTMLPHRGLPPGTPEPVADAFAVDYPEVEYASGVVVDPRTADDHGADVYALSTAQAIVGHAAAFRDAIVRTRERIPDDAALFLSGVATPANASLLAWAGVDLVDRRRAEVAGRRGRYLTTYGALDLEDLDELPCRCHVCVEADGDALSRSGCAAHNVAILEAELARIRERVRAGTLRDYVSARCRHSPWATAALREFDQEHDYVEARTPLFRSSRIEATTDDVLDRVEITRFADRVSSRYRCRFGRPLVLLPCSAAKPYSQSQSHRQFRDAIQYRAHRVALSSPVGVVPQELECTYPAQHYDTAVTGRWTPTEVDFVADCLAAYLDRNEYPKVIAHVPPGGYETIVREGAEAAGVAVDWTVADHPTTDGSLAALRDALDGELAYSRRKRRHATVRAIADYQFGPGAGDELFPPDIGVEAPYPKHRVVDGDGTHLATMVPEYGLLALTLAGARRWEESAVPTRLVEIDDFVPHGDVLAPGIHAADPDIRVGDEVVVAGPAAYGVGRATMHGTAMERSTRGVAVDLRHSEER